VTAVNDAPRGTDIGDTNAIPVISTGSHTFVAGDFGFSDPFDSPANNFLSVTIASLPAQGTLKVNGVTQNTVPFTVQTANLSQLTYTPAAGQTANASFTFQVRDDGGTANGGVDTD